MPRRKLDPRDVDQAAFLYAGGGNIDAIAEDFRVSPSGLRKAIRKFNGGRLPKRLITPPHTGPMQDAIGYLQGLRATLAAVEPDPDGYSHLNRIDAACREIRTAIEHADAAWNTAGAVAITQHAKQKAAWNAGASS